MPAANYFIHYSKTIILFRLGIVNFEISSILPSLLASPSSATLTFLQMRAFARLTVCAFVCVFYATLDPLNLISWHQFACIPPFGVHKRVDHWVPVALESVHHDTAPDIFVTVSLELSCGGDRTQLLLKLRLREDFIAKQSQFTRLLTVLCHYIRRPGERQHKTMVSIPSRSFLNSFGREEMKRLQKVHHKTSNSLPNTMYQ